MLSTKIGRILHAMKPGEKKPADFRENGLPGFAPVFDYTYDGVMRSLEHSHLRLGLAKIDIALIHDVDFWTIKDRGVLDERFKTVMDGGFKALDELRKAGVIGAIGVGINESDTSLRFIQAGDFDCMLLAGRYTLLEQGGLEEFLPECVKRNVSVILGGPYNSGILTGGVKPGATHDYVAAPAPLIEKAQKIEAVCQRHGVELGAAAMQFPLFHPALCAVIPGALSIAEVKQNVGRMSAKIPAELWSELKREKLLDPTRADTELSRHVRCIGSHDQKGHADAMTEREPPPPRAAPGARSGWPLDRGKAHQRKGNEELQVPRCRAS